MRMFDYSSAGVVASEIGDYSTLVMSLVRKAGFDSQTKASDTPDDMLLFSRIKHTSSSLLYGKRAV